MAPTSRRHLLATAGALPLVGLAAAVPAVAAANPDAALLAQGERFLELERQVVANHAACPHQDDVGFPIAHEAEQATDAANLPLKAEQEAILERMHDLRVTTLEGHRMRARVAFAYKPEMRGEGAPDGYNDQQLLWLLVRDLVGGASV